MGDGSHLLITMVHEFTVLGRSTENEEWYYVGTTTCDSPLDAVQSLINDGPPQEGGWSSLDEEEWAEHVGYWDKYKVMEVESKTYIT